MTPAEIIAEFRKKYEGCYIHVQMPDSTEDSLFYLASVTQTRGEPTGVLRLESEEFGKIQLNMGTTHTLKFKFPEVGTFQSGADAYFFRRNPVRQWRRGLCSDNAMILPVWGSLRSAGGMMGFTTVNDAFKGEYFTYAKATSMLESGKYRSVALANGFALVLSMTLDCQYYLMYRTLPIAKVNKGALTVMESSFETQLKQIIQ